MKRIYDDDYINHCISDLNKWRKLLADKENIDCILSALEDYKKMEPKVGLYLIFVWGDVEPEIIGPFETGDERDKKARDIRREKGEEHGIFVLDISEESLPEIFAYSGGFFEEE